MTSILGPVGKTGGRWDPTDRNLFFIASNISNLARDVGDNVLVAVNEIPETRIDTLKQWCSTGRKVFLDSGIFNLTNEHARAHGCPMDVALSLAPHEIDGFDDLMAKYLRIIQGMKDDVWGYIELDQGGIDNKIKTRGKLEAMGLRPIPVYHPINDGWDYFDELASKYDRICVGNFVQAKHATRVRLMATLWQRKRKYPDLWIHVLGMKPIPSLMSLPFESADASSWMTPLRWCLWPVHASMQRCGHMQRLFYYSRAVPYESPGGLHGIIPVVGHDVGWSQISWRNHLGRSAEEVGS